MKLYNIITNRFFEATEFTKNAFLRGVRPHLFQDKPSREEHLAHKGKKHWYTPEVVERVPYQLEGKILVGNDDGPEEVVDAAVKILKEFGIEHDIIENDDDTMEIRYKKK